MSRKPHYSRSIARQLGAIFLTLAIPVGTHAADDSSWLDHTRLALDMAVRGVYEGTSENLDGMQFFGIDAHKVFGSERGDIGTLIVQVYGTSLTDVEMHPAMFKDDDDTKIVYRNVNFNYTSLFDGRLNLRIGHFEVPFGIEHVINTNGSLRTYMHDRNIGVKGDWGFSVNGELSRFEYELAWTRGSGNSWESEGNPGMFVGRIGTLRSRNWAFGLSAVDGDIYMPLSPATPLERSRIGVDGHWYWRRFEFMGEICAGEDNGDDVVNALLEMDLHARDASWFAYTQVRRIRSADEDQQATSVTLGFEFEPDNHWTLSAEFTHDIEVFGTASRRNLFKAQVRYRIN